MREAAVEEQIQWILLYIQERLVNMWKENVLEDLEAGEMEYESAREFLAEIKKEFRKEDEESLKVAELKRESKREEEKLRGKKENNRVPASRQNSQEV